MKYLLLFLLSFLNITQKEEININLKMNESHLIDYCNIDNETYYYSKLISKDCDIVMKQSNDSSQKIILNLSKIDGISKYCGNTFISNITKYQDTLYFVFADIIVLYHYENDNTKFIKYIDLSTLFNKNILYFSKRIYLDYPYLYGEKSEYHTKRLDEGVYYYYRVNLQDYDENKFHNIDYPKGFYWTIAGPRNILDFGKNQYLTSDVSEYNINIYNYNDSLISHFSRKPVFWEATTYDNRKFIDAHPQQIFNFISSDTNTTCLIHRVNFIDENKILVCYSNNQKDSEKLYDFYFDIWYFDGKNWVLSDQDISIEEINRKYDIEFNLQYVISNNMLLYPQFDEASESQKLNILKLK